MKSLYYDRGTHHWEIAIPAEIESWVREPGNISVDQSTVETVGDDVDLETERDSRNQKLIS